MRFNTLAEGFDETAATAERIDGQPLVVCSCGWIHGDDGSGVPVTTCDNADDLSVRPPLTPQRIEMLDRVRTAMLDARMIVTDLGTVPDDTDCLNCGHHVGEVHGCHMTCPNCHAPLGACSE